MAQYSRIQNDQQYSKSIIQTGYALTYITEQQGSLCLRAKLSSGQFVTIAGNLRVDTQLQASSGNPVANSVIVQALKNVQEVTFNAVFDQLVNNRTDNVLSVDSTNYVTNNVITQGINKAKDQTITQIKTWVNTTYTIKDYVTASGQYIVTSKGIYQYVKQQLSQTKQQLLQIVQQPVKLKFSELTDVAVYDVKEGQSIYYHQGQWIPYTPTGSGQPVVVKTSLKQLQDVYLVSLKQDQVLSYDTTRSKWVNKTIAIDTTSINTRLNALSDSIVAIRKQLDTIKDYHYSDSWIRTQFTNVNTRIDNIQIPQYHYSDSWIKNQFIVVNQKIDNIKIPDYHYSDSWIRTQFTNVNTRIDNIQIPQYHYSDSWIYQRFQALPKYSDSIQALWTAVNTPRSLTELQDVSCSAVKDKELLIYNLETQKWKNSKLQLQDLSNVSRVLRETGSVLVYNQQTALWQAKPYINSLYNLDQIIINTADLKDGYILYYDEDSIAWRAKAPSYQNVRLIQLIDYNNQVQAKQKDTIIYDSETGLWSPGKINVRVQDLQNLTLNTPVAGQVFTYTGQQTWGLTSITQVTDSSLLDLRDVTGTPQEGAILKYNQQQQVWKVTPVSKEDTSLDTIILTVPTLIYINTSLYLQVQLKINNVYKTIICTLPVKAVNKANVKICVGTASDNAQQVLGDTTDYNWQALPQSGLNPDYRGYKIAVQIPALYLDKQYELRYRWLQYSEPSQIVGRTWQTILFPSVVVTQQQAVTNTNIVLSDSSSAWDDIYAIARRMALIFG